jgi:hypothetical protein
MAVEVPKIGDCFASASPILPALHLTDARQMLSSTTQHYTVDLAFALAVPWPTFGCLRSPMYIYPKSLSPNSDRLPIKPTSYRGSTNLCAGGLSVAAPRGSTGIRQNTLLGAWVLQPGRTPPTIITLGIQLDERGRGPFHPNMRGPMPLLTRAQALIEPLLLYGWSHLPWKIGHISYPVGHDALYALRFVLLTLLLQMNQPACASGPLAVEFLRQLSLQDFSSPEAVALVAKKKDSDELRAQHLALYDFECARSARILQSLRDSKNMATFKRIVTS